MSAVGRVSCISLAMGMVLYGCAAASAVDEAPAAPVRTDPKGLGFDEQRFRYIDEAVAADLAAKKLPGCVVLIGRFGSTAFLKAYGDRAVEPAREPMTTDTLFDLASITKPVATASSVMLLVERGKLRLQDRVAAHIPEFGQNGKSDITVLQLLTHQSGLIPDNPVEDYNDGRDKAFERIFALKPLEAPGAKFMYSDVGFIVLGELVQRVSGQNLADFTRENLYAPLGLKRTGYLPATELQQTAAPTEQRDGKWLRGVVHDPRAYHLGGVAGHAGLFSTAEELAKIASMFLHRGQNNYQVLGQAPTSVRVLHWATVAKMIAPVTLPGGNVRGLGWDILSSYSGNRGDLLSPAAYGHGGFTGTSLWIDPQTHLIVIFLSNRVHPDGKGNVNHLAGRIGAIAAGALVY